MKYPHNTQHDFEGTLESLPPINKIGQVERWLCQKFQRHDIYSNGGLYLRRWLLKRFGGGKLYLHKIYTRDQDRHLHDHPWNAFIGILGPLGYLEEFFPDNEPFTDIDNVRTHKEGKLVLQIAKTQFRRHFPLTARILKGEMWHRVILHQNSQGQEIPCWTLCLVTPKYRQWGFLTEYGKCNHENYFENYETFNPPTENAP